jgi:hypothetical protein
MNDVPHVPAALLKLPQWTCRGEDGDPMNKKPLNPRTGGGAMTNVSSTWSDYETASTAARRHGYAGVSFVITAKDEIIGVDLDHCRNAETGDVEPWAKAIVDSLPTYWEVSCSGTGLKGYAAGQVELPRTKWPVEGGSVEIYNAKKAFAFTAEPLEGTSLEVEDCTAALGQLVTRLEARRTAGAKKPKKPKKPGKAKPGKGRTAEQVLRRLAAGAKTGPLLEGDLSEYDDDASRADFALCLGAAGLVDGDPERIDEVYRLTPLMRAKWDEPRGEGTYGSWTIEKVLECYEPAPENGEAQKDVMIAQVEGMPFYHTADGTGFAVVSREDHEELLPIMGKAYGRVLRHQFWLAERKAPSQSAVKDALALLDARANYEGEEREIGVRVIGVGDAVYLDLADRLCRAVRITADGWEVVQNPFLFRRGAATKGLPLPVPGGSLAELRPFLNVADEDAFVLCCAWLVGSLRPRGPYPILALQGEHGSAKSMTAQLHRLLIDPAIPMLKSLPTSERDLMIAARTNWIAAYDNLSGIAPAMSDALCRLSTGGGLSTRELYTNDEEMIFDSTRPITINGIDDLTARADLVSRSLFVNLPPLEPEQRREEKEMLAEFELLRPRLLGALCTAVSASLANAGKVRLKEAPRMADFAADVVAAEPALPWERGRFLAAYAENERMMRELALDMDRVAATILELLREVGSWEGTATELLKDLRDPMSGDLHGRDIPGTPRSMANRMRRLAPLLRERGIEVEFRKGTERVIHITSQDGRQDRAGIGGARALMRPDRHKER